jgi:hypothetical protein
MRHGVARELLSFGPLVLLLPIFAKRGLLGRLFADSTQPMSCAETSVSVQMLGFLIRSVPQCW